jgi:hypothetical protein
LVINNGSEKLRTSLSDSFPSHENLILLLVRKFFLAFTISFFFRIPVVFKNIVIIFKLNSKKYDDLYSAAGFSKKTINDLVNTTLTRAASDAQEQSGSDIPLANFNLSLINSFILNSFRTKNIQIFLVAFIQSFFNYIIFALIL